MVERKSEKQGRQTKEGTQKESRKDSKMSAGSAANEMDGEQHDHDSSQDGASYEHKSQNFQLGTSVMDYGNHIFSSQRDRAVGLISGVSQALKDAAGKIQDAGAGQNSKFAGYVNTVIDKVDSFENSLANLQFETVVEKVKDFSKRRPEVIVGGLFLTGLAVGRMLRSAMPEGDSNKKSPRGKNRDVQASRLARDNRSSQIEVH